MLLVGLTGNIASGKSTAARELAARGATIIDSDVAAREAVRPGSPGLAAIVAAFGEECLAADGSLDRAAMGRLVFRDSTARAALERIIHPAVEATRRAAVHAARDAGAAVVICDVPLLFEVRLAWQFPRIVLVDAPAPARIARLVRDRGMSRDDAAARVQAQMSSALKRGRADVVIDNDRDHPAFVDAIETLWHRLQQWSPVADSNRAV